MFLSMMRNEGMLTLGEDEADELISDFLDAEQAKVDPTTNVKRLTESELCLSLAKAFGTN